MELTGMSVATGYHSHSTGNCKSKTTTLPTATAPDSQPNHIRNHRLFQLLTGWQLIRTTLYANSTHNTWIYTCNFIFPFRANEKSRSKWASIELLVWAMIGSCQTAWQCLSRGIPSCLARPRWNRFQNPLRSWSPRSPRYPWCPRCGWRWRRGQWTIRCRRRGVIPHQLFSNIYPVIWIRGGWIRF